MFEPDIECPSGLAGRVRGLTGQEFKRFANQEMVACSPIGDRILSSCWLKTFDVPRLYEVNGALQPDGTLDWRRVLSCDRLFAQSRIQQAGDPLGAQYSTKRQCQNCGHVFSSEVDESQDFKVIDIDRELLAAMAKDDGVQTAEIDEASVRFKLITGDELPHRLLPATQVGVEHLAARIIDVTPANGRVLRKSAIVPWLYKLTVRGWQDMIDEVDDIEGGFDTTVELKCPECKCEWDYDIPYPNRLYDPRVAKAIVRSEGETMDPGLTYVMRLPKYINVFNLVGDFAIRPSGMAECIHWDLPPGFMSTQTLGEIRVWRHRMDEVRQELAFKKGSS